MILTEARRKIRKFARLSINPEYRRGIQRGIAAAIEHEAAIRDIEVGTLIDIGANQGQFALLTRSLHPNAKVLAFEPLPEPAAAFRKLFAGAPDVKLFPYAVGPDTPAATMYLGASSDGSSLLSHPSEKHGTATVAVRRLDEMITPRDLVGTVLLKIDVQGFELHALRACGELLQCVHYVFAEVAFGEYYTGQVQANEIVDFLHGCGFRLSGLSNPAYDGAGRVIGADFMFVRVLAVP